MKEQSCVVNCRGCGGSGQQGPFHVMDSLHDCVVCGGTGRVRIEKGDSWCGRCGGTGKEKLGFPGFEKIAGCHICGGSGVIHI